ncbi:hypothetical protein VNO77_26888 [Canavalia gladiata]|uniref:Uncharacterized protein n=1 Tax=Canavalia gladiata TaxID=3824 RepID=A0AAN9KUD6_CANGL
MNDASHHLSYSLHDSCKLRLRPYAIGGGQPFYFEQNLVGGSLASLALTSAGNLVLCEESLRAGVPLISSSSYFNHCDDVCTIAEPCMCALKDVALSGHASAPGSLLLVLSRTLQNLLLPQFSKSIRQFVSFPKRGGCNMTEWACKSSEFEERAF